MKTGRALVGCCAVLGAAMLASRADDNGAPSSSNTPAPVHVSSAPTISPQGPWLQSFPPVHTETTEAPNYSGSSGDNSYGGSSSATGEGMDEADAERIADQTYATNQAKKNQPDENTLDQTAKQQAYAQDWMLRGYTAQLKKNGLEKADYTNPFLVPEPIDPAQAQLPDDSLLAQPEKKKPAKTAHSPSPFNDASTLTPKKSLAPLSFQPLLAPLIPPVDAHAGTAGAVDLDQVMPADAGTSLLPVPNSRPHDEMAGSTDNSEASLLDVPGLTAATQGGIAPNNAIDFDEPASNPNDRTHRSNDSNFLAPTAPASDVSEFFKKQAEALAPPMAPGVIQPVGLPSKPRLVVDPEPIAKPAVSGIRSHVDDPFDILRR